jgi:hypothetical protein
MTGQEYKFELPRNIERYLAALSKLYGHRGERLLQEIIVNAQTRVHVGWNYDNWGGGTYGHAVFLAVPDRLYITAVERKDELETRIKDDMRSLYNVQNESIDRVFLEMEVAEDSDWRRESGALLHGARVVPDIATDRIWVDGQYRLFLSHKSEVKKETAELKDKLSLYGVSCFVAHADIHPTQEWQDEIENALATMEGFVALVTEKFHESNWTDQEVGYAFARGVPIIAARLGRDPYGFIGKFQGLSCTWASAPEQIVKLLVKHGRVLDTYLSAMRRCPSFERGNALAAILPAIENPRSEQVDAIVEAYNANSELQGSFGFNGRRPAHYGPGLIAHLNRWSDQFQFIYDSSRIVRRSAVG